MIIAIDGPAGSGKSTTSRLVAERLSFRHLDTGAMYRALALKCVETGTEPADLSAMKRLLVDANVNIQWQADGYRVMLDGRDVSRAIREPRVNALVSEVSALSMVRQALVPVQREAARGTSVVCEGRDIGSVVFPDADLKVFLDCDIHARARRRQAELVAAGLRAGTTAVRRNLVKRDRVDSGRAVSPLVRTKDAVLVDTTDLTIEEQVGIICELARRVEERAILPASEGKKRFDR